MSFSVENIVIGRGKTDYHWRRKTRLSLEDDERIIIIIIGGDQSYWVSL